MTTKTTAALLVLLLITLSMGCIGNDDYIIDSNVTNVTLNSEFNEKVFNITEGLMNITRGGYKTEPIALSGSAPAQHSLKSSNYWDGRNIWTPQHYIINCGSGCNIDCGYDCDVTCGDRCNIDCGDDCVIICGSGCNIAHGERCWITHGYRCNLYLAYPD